MRKENSEIIRLARASNKVAASFLSSGNAETWGNEEMDFLFFLSQRLKDEIGDLFTLNSEASYCAITPGGTILTASVESAGLFESSVLTFYNSDYTVAIGWTRRGPLPLLCANGFGNFDQFRLAFEPIDFTTFQFEAAPESEAWLLGCPFTSFCTSENLASGDQIWIVTALGISEPYKGQRAVVWRGVAKSAENAIDIADCELNLQGMFEIEGAALEE